MARIAGVDLPNHKNVETALTYIFGVGRSLSKKICKKTKMDSLKKLGDLSSDELNQLRNFIDNNLKVEGPLRTEVSLNIKRLMDIGSNVGLRHRKKLPVRGQRTRTNARTRKGKKKTVAGKRK